MVRIVGNTRRKKKHIEGNIKLRVIDSTGHENEIIQYNLEKLWRTLRLRDID